MKEGKRATRGSGGVDKLDISLNRINGNGTDSRSISSHRNSEGLRQWQSSNQIDRIDVMGCKVTALAIVKGRDYNSTGGGRSQVKGRLLDLIHDWGDQP